MPEQLGLREHERVPGSNERRDAHPQLWSPVLDVLVALHVTPLLFGHNRCFPSSHSSLSWVLVATGEENVTASLAALGAALFRLAHPYQITPMTSRSTVTLPITLTAFPVPLPPLPV